MNSKCHKDNYKTRHNKTPRREHRQNALQHKSYQCFLRSISQGNRNKDKNKQMGANQAYKLFYSKGSHKQNEMTTYGMGENICKQCDQSGLISKVYKWLTQLNNIKKKKKKKKKQ